MAVKKARNKAAPRKKAAKKAKKVRCAAKTKEGKRCKRMAVGSSKHCSVHKK